MNPFQHGVVVSGKNFCPRPELLRELRGHLGSQQNCVIRGGRRMGKTSAVLEARGMKKNKRRDPGHITTEQYWKESG